MSAFNWQGQSSAIAAELEKTEKNRRQNAGASDRHGRNDPVSKARESQLAKQALPKAKRLNSEYQKKRRDAIHSVGAILSADREQEIRRIEKELPRHLNLSMTHEKPNWRTHHKIKYDQLLEKLAAIKALRRTMI